MVGPKSKFFSPPVVGRSMLVSRCELSRGGVGLADATLANDARRLSTSCHRTECFFVFPACYDFDRLNGALHFIPRHASTAAHASLCDIARSANLIVPASRGALAKHLQQNSDTSTRRVSLRFEFNCA